MTCPPAPYGYQLAVMLANGETDKADRLLASLNKLRTAFGGEPFVMPAPAGSINGLVTAPARVPLTNVRVVERADGSAFLIDLEKAA